MLSLPCRLFSRDSLPAIRNLLSGSEKLFNICQASACIQAKRDPSLPRSTDLWLWGERYLCGQANDILFNRKTQTCFIFIKTCNHCQGGGPGEAGGWVGLNYLGVCKGVRRKGWMELGLSSYDYAARVKVMACIHLPAASRTHLTRDTGTHPPPSTSARPEDACQWISISRSVVPDSLRPHGLQPTRLVCP